MIELIKNTNPCYIFLNILLGIVLFLELSKRRVSTKQKICFSFIYIVISIVSFQYLNGIVMNIFDLKYLSVKTYLIMVAIVNLIILMTLNKKLKRIYSILNYTLFIIITIILGSTIAVVLGNKFESLYIMDVRNAINFIDLSLVIFLLYLISICLTYIGYYIFSNKEELPKKEEIPRKNSLLEINIKNLKLPKIKLFHKKEKQSKTSSLLTEEELLHFDRNNTLYINGIDCNIIFEDSNWQNIFKNYQILNQDINARLVNGYTLEENKMLKSICLKLQVANLNHIDIHNVSILNKISIEEYMLLKKVFGSN